MLDATRVDGKGGGMQCGAGVRRPRDASYREDPWGFSILSNIFAAPLPHIFDMKTILHTHRSVSTQQHLLLSMRISNLSLPAILLILVQTAQTQLVPPNITGIVPPSLDEDAADEVGNFVIGALSPKMVCGD